jgi:putative transposase
MSPQPTTPESPTDTEVRPAKRAPRSAAERLRILEAYESYPAGSPERGALLRREGGATAAIATWRKLRRDAALTALSTQRPGPKAAPPDPVQAEFAQLRTENARLQARLAQAETIIDVQKNCHAAWGSHPADAAGRIVMQQAVTELAAQVGGVQACALLGVPRSAYYRPQARAAAPAARLDTPEAPQTPRGSPRALSPAEREHVLTVVGSERFVAHSPREGYATLLDAGVYLCGWSTLYRLLRAAGDSTRRRDIRRPPAFRKPELLARAPYQLWSWDITKRKGPATWTYFYRYVLIDVVSRYVVGWMIATRASAVLAEGFIAECCARDGMPPGQVTVHADRGSA